MEEHSKARKGGRHPRAKASFWIGGFPGGYERFELRGRILRHGHQLDPEMADKLVRRTLSAIKVEKLWRTIEISGCWRWSEPSADGPPIVDGVQWKLRLRHGARQLDLYGSNAFPPGSTTKISPEFSRLVGAFRAAARLRASPWERW